MKIPNIEDKGFIVISFLAAAIFFYLILGTDGAMSAIGIGLFFLIPTYFIINNFEFSQSEKLVFSFFIGVGVFPSIAYWLGVFIPFKFAIFATFFILVATGIIINNHYKK